MSRVLLTFLISILTFYCFSILSYSEDYKGTSYNYYDLDNKILKYKEISQKHKEISQKHNLCSFKIVNAESGKKLCDLHDTNSFAYDKLLKSGTSTLQFMLFNITKVIKVGKSLQCELMGEYYPSFCINNNNSNNLITSVIIAEEETIKTYYECFSDNVQLITNNLSQIKSSSKVRLGGYVLSANYVELSHIGKYCHLTISNCIFKVENPN